MSIQTLERAIALLRILAAAGAEGCRLVDLQSDTGLTKPTIHRILATLRKEELVDQIEATRRYRLGKELAVFGYSASRTFHDIKELAFDDMSAVAAKTADTCFLMIRSAHDTVCIDRQTGSYPVKAFVVEVGTRRPLGVGAAGAAMLGTMESDQAELVFDVVKGQLKRFPHASETRVRAAVSAARAHGFAVSDELMVRGVRAVGMCIRDAAGRPAAGISVAATSDRMPDDRIPEIVRTLRMHANRIEQRIAAADMLERHGANRIVRLSGRSPRG